VMALTSAAPIGVILASTRVIKLIICGGIGARLRPTADRKIQHLVARHRKQRLRDRVDECARRRWVLPHFEYESA